MILEKVSTFFRRISSGWVVLAALCILILYSGLTLPVESKRMEAYAPGLGSPDNRLFYSSQTLWQMAEAYGDAGRSAFLRSHWGFDLAFPFIYTFFFITSISYAYKKGIARDSRLWWVNLVPLLGMVFDLAENTSTSVVMATFSIKSQLGLSLGPVFTPLKWLFVILSTVLLLIGLSLWLINGLKKGFNHSK